MAKIGLLLGERLMVSMAARYFSSSSSSSTSCLLFQVVCLCDALEIRLKNRNRDKKLTLLTSVPQFPLANVASRPFVSTRLGGCFRCFGAICAIRQIPRKVFHSISGADHLRRLSHFLPIISSRRHLFLHRAARPPIARLVLSALALNPIQFNRIVLQQQQQQQP